MTLKLVNDSFEEFWKLYPRKTGKLRASVVYSQVLSGKEALIEGDRVSVQGTAEEILEGLKRYLQANTAPVGFLVEQKYIPLASTWLNQGRFLD